MPSLAYALLHSTSFVVVSFIMAILKMNMKVRSTSRRSLTEPGLRDRITNLGLRYVVHIYVGITVEG